MVVSGKRILITGGTGSLGKALLKRIADQNTVTVFSRDEAKQDELRKLYPNVIFKIGDVRNYSSVVAALQDIDVVFNAAAMKQVPTCEYFPYEAVQTNIDGAENIVRAIEEFKLPIKVVIGISTDKACKPVNVMGMTKAIQERIFLQANQRCPNTEFMCVRYGNVLASRGSVIPLFQDQTRQGRQLTVTTKGMTRFLLTLDQAVDTILDAYFTGDKGDIFVPIIPSARVVDIAKLIAKDEAKIEFTGIRPGEKIHEILVSEEEAIRTRLHNKKYYVIASVFSDIAYKNTIGEFSSADNVMSEQQLKTLLSENGFLD